MYLGAADLHKAVVVTGQTLEAEFLTLVSRSEKEKRKRTWSYFRVLKL